MSGGTGTGCFFAFARVVRLVADAVDEPPFGAERVDAPGAAPTPAEALVTAEP